MHLGQIFYALTLIPICSLLNHLGGQSTRIPCPRFVCRMLGIGAAFGAVSRLCGLPIDTALLYGTICVAGMTLWAVWKNGPQFMAINETDFRDYKTPWYTPNRHITALCDFGMNVSQFSTLTSSQCVEWGALYGTILGLFLYPMFITMAVIITPWAFLIGMFCLAQGEIYRACKSVLIAEYVFGACIGLALSAVLIEHIVAS